MEEALAAGIVTLAVLGFVAWLGGGRKWAFRILLSALVLVAVGFGGVLLYAYISDKVAEHRAHKIHDCAIAKIAMAQCTNSKDGKYEICPPYVLLGDATSERVDEAVRAAEQECRKEIDPIQQSSFEQVVQYKRAHGVKGDLVDANKRMTAKACAAKVRSFYPHAYEDLDDATLTKKVLAKYPTYCDVTSSPPDLIPDIQGIR